MMEVIQNEYSSKRKRKALLSLTNNIFIKKNSFDDDFCQIPKFIEPSSNFEEKSQMQSYLHLLELSSIKRFLVNDPCFIYSDKYLLAMTFIYFERLHPIDYSSHNFFLLLYLANDMEEDEYFFRVPILTALFGQSWAIHASNFIQSKFEMLKKMNYRAIVSMMACEQVIKLDPDHPVWLRNRLSHHGGVVFNDNFALNNKFNSNLQKECLYYQNSLNRKCKLCIQHKMNELMLVKKFKQKTATDELLALNINKEVNISSQNMVINYSHEIINYENTVYNQFNNNNVIDHMAKFVQNNFSNINKDIYNKNEAHNNNQIIENMYTLGHEGFLKHTMNSIEEYICNNKHINLDANIISNNDKLNYTNCNYMDENTKDLIFYNLLIDIPLDNNFKSYTDELLKIENLSNNIVAEINIRQDREINLLPSVNTLVKNEKFEQYIKLSHSTNITQYNKDNIKSFNFCDIHEQNMNKSQDVKKCEFKDASNLINSKFYVNESDNSSEKSLDLFSSNKSQQSEASLSLFSDGFDNYQSSDDFSLIGYEEINEVDPNYTLFINENLSSNQMTVLYQPFVHNMGFDFDQKQDYTTFDAILKNNSILNTDNIVLSGNSYEQLRTKESKKDYYKNINESFNSVLLDMDYSNKTMNPCAANYEISNYEIEKIIDDSENIDIKICNLICNNSKLHDSKSIKDEIKSLHGMFVNSTQISLSSDINQPSSQLVFSTQSMCALSMCSNNKYDSNSFNKSSLETTFESYSGSNDQSVPSFIQLDQDSNFYSQGGYDDLKMKASDFFYI